MPRSSSTASSAARLLTVFAAVMLLVSGTGFAALPQAPTPPQIVPFSAATASKIAPAELIQHADLFTGGGSYPGCMETMRTLEGPTLDYQPYNLDLTDIAMISTCGWQPGETVKVTVMDPQGRLSSVQVKAVPAANVPGTQQVSISYQPGVDMPEGKYRFFFEGSGSVRAKVNYLRPRAARMYVVSVDPFQPASGAVGPKHRLMLDGFLPEEPVKLFAYQLKDETIQFYAWQSYTVDRLGRLWVDVDLPEIAAVTEMVYYAYGRDAHTVPLKRFTADGFPATLYLPLDPYCPGAQPSRLVGSQQVTAMQAVVAAADAGAAGGPVTLHEQPGFGARLAGTVKDPAAAQMRTFGYPRCIDGEYWWQVSVRSAPYFGWAAEGFQGSYLLAPAK